MDKFLRDWYDKMLTNGEAIFNIKSNAHMFIEYCISDMDVEVAVSCIDNVWHVRLV